LWWALENNLSAARIPASVTPLNDFVRGKPSDP